MKMNIVNAKVYVCNKELYAQGKYIDLIHYEDYETFKAECLNPFKQNKVEYLYFDYDNIPDVYITENWISPNLFPLIRAVSKLDIEQQKAFSAWLNFYKADIEERKTENLISFFQYCYEGKFINQQRFASQYAKNQLNITRANSPTFDFKAYSNLLFRNLFQFIDSKYVFKTIQMI